MNSFHTQQIPMVQGRATSRGKRPQSDTQSINSVFPHGGDKHAWLDHCQPLIFMLNINLDARRPQQCVITKIGR